MKKFIFLLLPFLFSCEKDFHPDVNYVYTFSALVHKDEWGLETWGAHQFIVDNKIENLTKFKECYVNYLKWSGLDEDGMYKKIYYADPKHVKVEFLKESRLMWTVSAHDGCQ